MKKKYMYYCDDCKCFVKENHRCQQWGIVHMIPKEAIDKLLETPRNSDYVKCKKALRLIFEAAMDADRQGELYDSFDGKILDMTKEALSSTQENTSPNIDCAESTHNCHEYEYVSNSALIGYRCKKCGRFVLCV